MTLKTSVLVATSLCVAFPAIAEPTGRWWSGWGQGTGEYGIKNDSAGGDSVYIACRRDTSISFTVGGVDPKPGSTIIVTIGRDEFELFVGKHGTFEAGSHVGYDTFRSLWTAMRGGANMRVRLTTGQPTNFTLKGAARILGRKPCATDFERPEPS